jgi:UTP--glucose-1-phosphate uridylyltransferase
MVHKALLPVAGLGTRFLPVTKAVPKELLPIVDKPAIQYIVEECVAAGVDDMLLVTSSGKSAIVDFFDRSPALEAKLLEKNKLDEYEIVRELAEIATIHSVRQGEALGLGHAVLQGAVHIGEDESFVVILGDDLLNPGSGFLARMIEAHERTGRPVLALLEVSDDEVSSYGVADVAPSGRDGEYFVHGVVEKPEPGMAPSNFIVVGRYVLPGTIFPVLRDLPAGHGGEIQLTDALAVMAEQEPLVGLVLDGPRYDTGDRLGYLKANIELAVQRDDLRDELLTWMRAWLGSDDATTAEKDA